MAYMLLQRWHAPVPLELHPAGKVSIAGSELQGWWAHEGAENNLSVCFRFNEDSEAQTLLFQEIQGTDAQVTVKALRSELCYLAPIARPQRMVAASPADSAEPQAKKFEFILLVPGAEPLDLVLGYSPQEQPLVSVGSRAPHGSWLSHDALNTFEITFHWAGRAARAKRAVFDRVIGTNIWEKVNGDRRYKCFLCLKDESPDR